MNWRISICAIFMALALILGCGPKVMFPPEIELKEYQNVGLINFSSNAEGNLGEYVTQRFLARISLSQKGAGIVELGSMEEALKSVQQDKIGPEAIKALGQKYNLGAIIIGNLDVSDIKPKINIATIISHMSIEAEVEASLTVKLLETLNGATVWTDSAQGRKNVANVSIFSGGKIYFDAQDPDEAYGELTEYLVEEATDDLRISYRRM